MYQLYLKHVAAGPSCATNLCKHTNHSNFTPTTCPACVCECAYTILEMCNTWTWRFTKTTRSTLINRVISDGSLTPEGPRSSGPFSGKLIQNTENGIHRLFLTRRYAPKRTFAKPVSNLCPDFFTHLSSCPGLLLLHKQLMYLRSTRKHRHSQSNACTWSSIIPQEYVYECKSSYVCTAHANTVKTMHEKLIAFELASEDRERR